MAINLLAVSFLTALGAGLLVGVERQQRHVEGEKPIAMGVRTFTLVSLMGFAAALTGGPLLIGCGFLGLSLLVLLTYQRSGKLDPGLTTEVSLLLVFFLGALTVTNVVVAATLSVTTAALLAAKPWLHEFVRSTLRPQELNDLLILAGFLLVLLPLAPNTTIDPWNSLNPHKVVLLASMMMVVDVLGHLATRICGPRYGLSVSGFLGGFVSSSATIGAMGALARRAPDRLAGAVAAALFSTVATMVFLASMVASLSLPMLKALTVPLLCGGCTALVYGGIYAYAAFRSTDKTDDNPVAEAFESAGKGINIGSAITLAAVLSAVSLLVAILNAHFGSAGISVGAVLAGFADAHSAAIGVTSLVATGAASPDSALVPILLAVTSNTATKVLCGITTGSRAYVVRISIGLFLVLAAVWGGAMLSVR